MAKKPTSKRINAPTHRQTNWVLLGGIIAGGILILAALLILATQEPDIQSITAYCDENPNACFSLGEPDAPVTMVEVADFACSFCRNFHVETLPALEAQYIASGDVRLVMLPYALGDATIPSANASVCAGQQEQFFPFAAAMYAGYDDPTTRTRDGFMAIAEDLGLDTEEFGQCVAEARYVDMIRDNIDVASRNGVTSTPTFFLNDSIIKGAVPFATFQQRIGALLGS